MYGNLVGKATHRIFPTWTFLTVYLTFLGGVEERKMINKGTRLLSPWCLDKSVLPWIYILYSETKSRNQPDLPFFEDIELSKLTSHPPPEWVWGFHRKTFFPLFSSLTSGLWTTFVMNLKALPHCWNLQRFPSLHGNIDTSTHIF